VFVLLEDYSLYPLKHVDGVPVNSSHCDMELLNDMLEQRIARKACKIIKCDTFSVGVT
jgi:hypothetical protein